MDKQEDGSGNVRLERQVRRDELIELWQQYAGTYGIDEFKRALDLLIDAEREWCARLCEYIPYGTGLAGKTYAEAIRGVGLGAKWAEGFDA